MGKRPDKSAAAHSRRETVSVKGGGVRVSRVDVGPGVSRSSVSACGEEGRSGGLLLGGAKALPDHVKVAIGSGQGMGWVAGDKLGGKTGEG